MVESLGHEAHVVADGEEAEAACRRFGPYLVLMDLEMPRMNGIEATRRLLSLARIGAIAPCRVMMCTSVTDLRPLRLAPDAGAEGGCASRWRWTSCKRRSGAGGWCAGRNAPAAARPTSSASQLRCR